MSDPTSLQPPSRYKSQRRKQPPGDETAQPLPSTTGDVIVGRSRSRYHRKPTNSTGPPDNARLASQEQRNDVPSRYHSQHRESPMKSMYQEQVVETPGQHCRTGENTGERYEPPAESGAADLRSFSGNDIRYETGNASRQRLHESSSGNRLVNPIANLSSSPQRPPFHSMPSGELFPPPKHVTPPKIDGPPQSSDIRATKSVDNLPRYGEAGEEAGCFSGMFKRRKGDVTSPTAEKAPTARPRTAKDYRAIKAGGGGIVPGTDAPVSAINAGDRQVLIECNRSQRSFLFTPETTVLDLIKSAATYMSERIDVNSAILLESFGTVGVERPLRRYERIRDVMNSWDHDRQNSLVLIDPGTGSVEPELTIDGVPKQEPSEQTWYLKYSQKPGKWENRYVTLRGDGQMVQSKDPDPQPKDLTNFCHLSDFDIYTPAKDKAKKKFKPPKSHCYAIKSQQKTSLFESTQDYVHLFSTGDAQIADSFHDAVQAWRSWYLVNVMGEGKKGDMKAKPSPSGNRVVSNEQVKTHRAKGSTGSHYQLGSCKPLMGDFSFDRPEEGNGFVKSSNQFDINVSPERRTSTAKRQHPPVALSKKTLLAEDEPVGNLTRHGSVNRRRSSLDQRRTESSDFDPGGLLGKEYTQRRKENDAREAQHQQPFTGGLVGGNGGMPRQTSVRKPTTSAGEVKRTSSTRNNGRNGGHVRGGSVDLQRSGSRREPSGPLVDLTPQFNEPPQHSKKGKGYKPATIGAGGLIESATSPEDPLNIPSHTIFRNTSGQYGAQSGSGLVDLTPQHREPIHHSRKGKGYQAEPGTTGLVGHATTPDNPLGLPQNNIFRSTNAMPEGRPPAGSTQPAQSIQRQLSTSRPKDGFISGGLLSQEENRQGQGTSSKGRGVIDGSHAGGKPLIDLQAESTFVKGSLLKQVERAQGGPVPAPVIDREKRDERTVKSGERY